jgi:hypothetical protein
MTKSVARCTKGLVATCVLTASALAGSGGCVSSNNAGPNGNDGGLPPIDGSGPSIDATLPDAGTADAHSPSDTGLPPGQDGGPGDSAPIDTGSGDTGPSDAGVLAPAATVDLGDVPQHLAYNHTTDTFYATLESKGGIAVVDAVAGTVTGTLTAPPDAGANVVFETLEVDESANLVFTSQYRTLYSFNGATKAPIALLDLSSVPLGSGSARIYGLAADPSAKRLYAVVGYISGAQTIAVIDTTSGLSLVTTYSASDLVQGSLPFGRALVLDAQTHLLFLSGYSTSTAGYPTGVDAFDTTTGSAHGAQQVFPGSNLGAAAVPGMAALVTDYALLTDGGTVPPQIELLEPASVNLPTTFTPTSFDTGYQKYYGLNWVSVFGTDDNSGSLVSYDYYFCGEAWVHATPFKTIYLNGTGLKTTGTVRGTSLSSAYDIWVTSHYVSSDAGAEPTLAYRLHIDQTFLPPPPDGGGCADAGF